MNCFMQAEKEVIKYKFEWIWSKTLDFESKLNYTKHFFATYTYNVTLSY